MTWLHEHGGCIPEPDDGRVVRRSGYTSIRVLPELTGKPWNEITKAYVSGLRPSKVREVREFMTSDARDWRVSVHLDGDDRIKYIEQEVVVELPDGVAHGYDLQCRLARVD